MRKKALSVILAACLLLAGTALTACSTPGGPSPDPAPIPSSGNDLGDPSFANEEEGVELKTEPHDESDFIGHWSAKSDRAEYLYGNVDLSIYEDHTWDGNVTEEDVEGTWTPGKSGIVIKDKEGMVNFRLYFVSDGTLMFKDLNDPGEGSLVLKPGS